MDKQSTVRRPVQARETKWAFAAAGWLKQVGVRPNQISMASVVFAALAGACLVLGQMGGLEWRIALLIAAAACILLRGLCNVLDGLVAIEGGLKSKSGEIFNDLPDRLADSIIFVCAGYSITWLPWGSDLGWLAGLLAVMTAYVRVLGGSTGVPQDFVGPMAKQHRMAVMAAACLLAAVELSIGSSGNVMTIALGVIAIGCVVTIARRTRRIVQALESR